MRSRSPLAGSAVNITPDGSRRDLPLDDDGDVHVRLPEAALRAVVRGCAPRTARPSSAARHPRPRRPLDVQERLVHPGERRGRGVLGGRRRSHRDGRALAQPAVRLADRRGELLRHRGVGDERPRLLRGRVELPRLLHVHVGQQRVEPLAQPGRVAERRVRGGTDDEARGDRQARGRQLAEVGALAAGEGDVGAAQLGQRPERGRRGRREARAHAYPIPDRGRRSSAGCAVVWTRVAPGCAPVIGRSPRRGRGICGLAAASRGPCGRGPRSTARGPGSAWRASRWWRRGRRRRGPRSRR